MIKQRGFIFLSTVIFMSVISLLVLTQFRHFYSYYKLLSHHYKREQLQYKVENTLLYLQHNSFFPKPCTLVKSSGNKAINLLKAHKGCLIIRKNMHYLYLIEDLGLFSSIINNAPGGRSHSHQRRLTIALVNGSHISEGIQMKYIEKTSVSLMRSTKKSKAQYLISSWRYFD